MMPFDANLSLSCQILLGQNDIKPANICTSDFSTNIQIDKWNTQTEKFTDTEIKQRDRQMKHTDRQNWYTDTTIKPRERQMKHQTDKCCIFRQHLEYTAICIFNVFCA